MPIIKCPKGHDVEVDAEDLIYEQSSGGKHVSVTIKKDKTFHVCDKCGMFTRDAQGRVFPR
jgi:hypothetical protein